MRVSTDRRFKGLEQDSVTGYHQSTMPNNKEAVKAASALFLEYGAFIRTTIRFLAKNEFQVDDLFQQFFLSLVDRPIPADVKNIKSYLYRAMTNDVVDSARRKIRERKHFEKLAGELRNSIHKRASAHAVTREDGKAAIACLLRQLRKREAEAVVLRYQEDRSIAEIAQIMGVDDRTVSHYLAAALRHLRRFRDIE